MNRGTVKLALNSAMGGLFFTTLAPVLTITKAAQNAGLISGFDIAVVLLLILLGNILMAVSFHAIVDHLPGLLDD